jgi:hypothetical protein
MHRLESGNIYQVREEIAARYDLVVGESAYTVLAQ